MKSDQISILLNEYNQVTERIERYLKRQDFILTAGIAIIVGFFTFAFSNDVSNEVYGILPAIPIIIYSHIIYEFSRSRANQQYRKYLENRLNSVLPKESSICYTRISSKYLTEKNILVFAKYIIIAFVTVFCFIASIVLSDYQITVIIICLACFLFAFSITVLGFFQIKEMDKNIFNDIKNGKLFLPEEIEFYNSKNKQKADNVKEDD